jgi:hypothetical protein
VFVGEASALSALRGKCEPKRRDLGEEIETCGRHRAGCCLLWPRPCTCFGYSGTGHCAERVQSPLGTTGPSPSTLPPQILELWNEVLPVPFFPQIEVEILSLALGPCAGASWCCPTMGGWRRSCRGRLSCSWHTCGRGGAGVGTAAASSHPAATGTARAPSKISADWRC